VRHRLESIGGNKNGISIACIDPVGNVHYDQTSWQYSIGSIRQTPFSTLWREARDPRLAVLRNRTPHLPNRCQCCQFLGVCNGNSRIRADLATGNWLGIDPACYLYETERFSGSN
jgi:radical SAM protein with 4Fe4S-binding SPASM domain